MVKRQKLLINFTIKYKEIASNFKHELLKSKDWNSIFL